MASPPLLDFAALIEPVPGENPAGDSIPFEVKQKLEEGRKEDNPDDFAPDDPARQNLKKADWPSVIRVAKETLTRSSKDLLVAARLTEGLTRQHGYAGLRDGLHLLYELVENCWDRINPSIEDGDLEVRAGPFNWLDVADRGARFPETILRVPLVLGDDEPYSWRDRNPSSGAPARVSLDDFEKAIQRTPAEYCQNVADDLAQSQEELNNLVNSLAAKMGDASPGLTGVRQSLEQCQSFYQQVLLRKRVGTTTGIVSPGVATADTQPGTESLSVNRVVSSRADAYRQLAQAAAVLQQLEPHSPIPYLIQRAVDLGAMPFPQLIRELVRDSNIIAGLNRELGIKEESEAAPSP